MRFGTWNVWSLHRAGSLAAAAAAAAKELAGYKLDLVGVEEVRWGEGDTVRAGDFFFLWKRKRKSIGNRFYFFVHHRILLAVTIVQVFISLYRTPRCDLFFVQCRVC